MFKQFLAVATFAAFSVGSADAAPLKFWVNLGGAAANGNSFSYSSSGVDFTVSGFTHTDGVLGDAISLVKRGKGLGAESSGGGNLIDGRGKAEMLVFDFEQAVRIKKVIVKNSDHRDDLVVASYNGTTLDGYQSGLNVRKHSAKDGDYDGSARDTGVTRLGQKRLLQGSVLGIGAGERDDNFAIKRIRLIVDVPSGATRGRTAADGNSNPPISPVPLPAGGLLLLTALGGVGLMRYRRKG